ncbi:hypothetical protein ACVI3S_006527 [Bradyrhizobium diazoefficiens]
MARLPLIDPETTSGDIRASFDRMPVKLNIFRMMAHAEANMIPAMRLGNSILHKQKLSAVNRELLILQAAQLEGGAPMSGASMFRSRSVSAVRKRRSMRSSAVTTMQPA